MKKTAVYIIFSIGIASYVNGQKKELKISDFASWKRIENQEIDNGGKFVSYELNPNKGDGNLLIYNLKDNTSDTIPRAKDAQFDYKSKFIAFYIYPQEDTIRKLKLAKTKKDQMPKDSLGIMDLSTKQIIKFKGVTSFKLPEKESSWIAFLSESEKPKKDTSDSKTKKTNKRPVKNSKDKDLKHLTILEPFTDHAHSFSRVDHFAMASKGHTVAFSTKINDTTDTYGIVVFNTLLQKADTIYRDSVTIKRITIDELGKHIAFLASADTVKEKTYSLYYSPTGNYNVSKIVDTLTASIPHGWGPSENGNVFFSNDATKLYFGTSNIPAKSPKDSILDEEVPKLDVWSWTDKEIQPMQKRRLEQEKKRTYLAVYRIKENKSLQLADTLVAYVQLVNKSNADWALGINTQPYLRERVWDTQFQADYYIINLKTGERKLILESNSRAQLSPTTKYTVWYNEQDSNYYSLNISNQKITALTKNIPVALYDEENDTPSNPSPYGIMGWTEKDEALLIYDRFDIWKLDPTGKKEPVNLTKGYGRINSIRFRYQDLDREKEYISTQEDIILMAYDEKQVQQGFWKLNLSKQNSLQKLLMGNFRVGSIKKAKEEEQVVWTKQTVADFPNIYFSSLTFDNITKLSNGNPQQDNYIWPTAELIEWVSFAGDSLRGILYKPNNFDPNKKYPMISYFYERSSHLLHQYHTPQPSRSTINISFYTSNGYLVFVPDIAYKIGYPGQSAYNAIVSGVNYLTNTRPFIDSKRLGLQGQSWGGYQIAYLVTQTDMFAAAMAGAPVSNMTSAYGGIRWGTGMSRMFQYEQSQSRIGGTLWEKPLLYIENSPVFMAPKINTPLLIMHNDNDGAVPWYQGIEFFMALYRLNKPVWMLTYNGMDHNIESKYWANRIDLSTRMFQFFNHYLKDEEKPEWMEKGVPAVEKGESLGY